MRLPGQAHWWNRQKPSACDRPNTNERPEKVISTITKLNTIYRQPSHSLPISYNPLKRTFGNGSGKKLITMIKELRLNSGGESHWNDFPINFIKTLYIQALKMILPLLPVTCHCCLSLSPKHVRLDNIERVAFVEAQKRGGRWRKA